VVRAITPRCDLARPCRGAQFDGTQFDTRAGQLEVLFCYQPVDEDVMHHLRAYAGKTIVSAEREDLKLSVPRAAADALGTSEAEALVAWLREKLGERVAGVKPSVSASWTPR
jgi:molecular chaperone HtpG